MTVHVDWHGGPLSERILDAAVDAAGDTAAAAARRARASHPGWKSHTGGTEASIQAERATRDRRSARVKFGSSMRHFIFLEIGSRGRAGDHTLRRAGDVEGGHFAQRIAARLRLAR